jgi:hypothetical protein
VRDEAKTRKETHIFFFLTARAVKLGTKWKFITNTGAKKKQKKENSPNQNP